MVLSRAAFGVHGQKVPGIVSWLTSIGWETFLSIMAVLATATVFSRLGLPSGTPVLVAATVAVAALIVVASVLGYHTIMKLQSVLTWITGAITILYVLLTFSHIDVDAVLAVPNGTPQQVIGALVMVMTGFGTKSARPPMPRSFGGTRSAVRSPRCSSCSLACCSSPRIPH